MNLKEKFNFDDVKEYDKINVNLDKTCFLAKIPNTKKNGKIERLGDLFYGVKNNEPNDINIAFYNDIYFSHPFSTLIIKSGEIRYLNVPLIMIALFQQNHFHYKIYKNNIFDYFTFTYNVDFIYGYVTSELQQSMLSKSPMYNFVNCDYKIHLYCDGYCYAGIGILFLLYPDFAYECEYNKKNLIDEFIKLNTHWTEII